MNQTKQISIVLADDHSIVREGLAAFCDARPELHIAGQCADGLAAVDSLFGWLRGKGVEVVVRLGEEDG